MHYSVKPSEYTPLIGFEGTRGEINQKTAYDLGNLQVLPDAILAAFEDSSSEIHSFWSSEADCVKHMK